MVITTKSVRRYFTTVRYLRFCQITGQLRRRLYPLFERPQERLISSKAVEFPSCRWHLKESFLPPGSQGNSEADMLSGHFSFLNAEQNLGWPPKWNYDNLPRLWQYNLHYFEWLWAMDYEDARGVILDWITWHTLATGRVGLEPYPLSLRLMNWCGVLFAKFRQQTEEDEDFVCC